MTAKPTQNATGSRRWVFWMFLVLALFYLGFEHRAHLAGTLRWLPLAILLLCPFMHKGHGGHGGHGRGGNADDTPNGSPDTRGKPAMTDERSDTSHRGH